MAKLKREAHVLGLSWIFNGQWDMTVGDDIDDLSIEMNGSFEESKNILGHTRVTDNGYTPSISVDSYHANPGDKIYPFLLDLAMNRKTGIDCKAIMKEMVVDNITGGSNTYKAWIEFCYIEIVSYGGAAGNALPIVYNIHPCGKRKEVLGFIQNGVFHTTADGDYLLELAAEKA